MSSMKPPAAAVLFVVLAACSTAAQQSPRSIAPTDVAATVGSTAITFAQLDEQALQHPAGGFGNVKLSQAIYEARRAELDEMIGDTLLDEEARVRGIDRAAILSQEVSSKVAPPSQAEVDAWYEANRGRVQGATLEQVREPIRRFLVQERTDTARAEYVNRLKAKTPVKVFLDPPRLSVKSGDAPARGPSGAPIEMIEFSDFQCPYCLRVNPTVKRVMDTYGDRIRLVYRNYPLPNHANARPAAEAAQCANEQGKFWPYHDRLFENQSKLGDADLKQSAADVGLDTARFNACVDSHKYKGVVDTDLAEGNEAGVDGTPAFFINGRILSGAQPFDAFKRIIDEELQRAGK